jgi:hypothetical protein
MVHRREGTRRREDPAVTSRGHRVVDIRLKGRDRAAMGAILNTRVIEIL